MKKRRSMDERARLSLFVALSVLLAGCFGGSATGTASPDGVATTATPTPSPTETPVRFGGEAPPPGVDGSGVTDVDALLSAHADALADRSATVSISFRLTVDGSGRNVSLAGKTLPGADRGWLQVRFADGVGTYYTEDGTTYARERVNGTTNYGTTTDVSAVPERPRFGADERVRSAIEAAEWEPVGTVERDGRTLFEFRATEVDPPNVDTSGDTAVGSSGRLLVDGQGVVHLVAVSTTVENDRGTVEYGITVRLTDVGTTTVEEPDWIDRAR